MPNKFSRGVVAVSTAVALSLGTAPLAAAETPTLSSEIKQRLWDHFTIGAIGSSVLSSMVGIPQCSLFDTRGC